WPARFVALQEDLKSASAVFVRNRASHKTRDGNSAQGLAYGSFDIEDPSAGWRFEPGIPALLHPVILDSAAFQGNAFEGKKLRAESVDWIAVELNPQVIRTKILSDLAQTYFQGTDGLDYLVAVISRNTPGRVLYSSDSG